jgi:hypothetical protein
MVKGVDGRLRLAVVILSAAALLFAANYGYGLAHEAAHAVVIDALGGHVSGIYVNPLGTDAYTGHTVVTGATDLVLVNVAGLCMTTMLAFVFMALNQGLLATFLAGRTAMYALNYTPGTDISTIYGVAGNASILISIFVVAINISCIYIALKPSGLSFIASHLHHMPDSRRVDDTGVAHIYGEAMRQTPSPGE